MTRQCRKVTYCGSCSFISLKLFLSKYVSLLSSEGIAFDNCEMRSFIYNQVSSNDGQNAVTNFAGDAYSPLCRSHINSSKCCFVPTTGGLKILFKFFLIHTEAHNTLLQLNLITYVYNLIYLDFHKVSTMPGLSALLIPFKQRLFKMDTTRK